MSEKDNNFLHIRGDKDFQERSNSVFSGLDRLEPQKEEEKELKRVIKRRPNLVPDHVLHPHKWTKYSLEEDGSEKLGRMNANEINKHAALSFLDELKERKKSGEEKHLQKSADSSERDSNIVESKHCFSKPISKDDKGMEIEGKTVIKQKERVHMMPEYVVGKTKLPAKPKKELNAPQEEGNKDKVEIGHLLQRQEDELGDSDVQGSGEGSSVASEEFENKDAKNEGVKFAKRKRKQDKNIRKHVNTSDGEEND